jgi:colanic acid/amylovoran biosynthesis protein
MERINKNIAILHAHNTFNNGSFAMLINLIYYMDKNLPGDYVIDAWVELDGTDNEQRLLAVLNHMISDKIQIRFLPLKITSPDNGSLTTRMAGLYAKWFIHPGFMKKLGISAVILLGGDDISEYYKKWMIISDLIRIRRYSSKFLTLLAGQTIGPFRGIREKMAACCLAGTYVFSRDTISNDYLLKKLKLRQERLFKSSDLAFADLPDHHVNDPVNHYELVPGNYICFVPGGFFTLYTGKRTAYIRCWTELILEFVSSGLSGGKKLVFLPHVTRPEDDRKIFGELENLLPHSNDLLFIYDELFPSELRQLLGNSHYIISSRMHASISAFQMGIPALSLGFSVKYHGVIGQSLQCPELIVDASRELFDNPGLFAVTVLDKVHYITGNYVSLKERINKMIPALKKEAIDQVNRITKLIIS